MVNFRKWIFLKQIFEHETLNSQQMIKNEEIIENANVINLIDKSLIFAHQFVDCLIYSNKIKRKSSMNIFFLCFAILFTTLFHN